MVLVILVGVVFFSRLALEHALILKEFERVRVVTERANEAEISVHEVEEESDLHLDELEGEIIIKPEHWRDPSSLSARAAFSRYLVEFKDPTVKGIVIFDSVGGIITSLNENSPRDLLGIKDSGPLATAYFYEIFSEDGKEIMYSYVPFVLDGELLGAVEVASDLEHVLSPIDNEMKQIVVRLLVTGLITLLIIYYIQYKFILRPIHYLSLKTKEIGDGDLDSPIVLTSQDEFGTLAGFLETMRLKLRSYREHEEAKLEASIESLKFGFVILDNKKSVVMGNKTASDIFGPLKYGDSLESMDKFFGEKLSVSLSYEKCIGSKEAVISNEIDAHDKFYKVSMFPVVADKVIGAVVVVDDITDAVLLARNKEEFFVMASHELRTPLTSIRGNMSMIKDYYKDKISMPEVMSMVDHTFDSSVRLLKIINDFLDVSKFEKGYALISLESVDLNKIAKSVVDDIVPMAKEKGLEIRYQDTTGLPPVMADEVRLKQVVYNLIGNAINYTERGYVEVRVEDAGNSLKLVVKDTGVGISPQNQALLFKKFQQAGKTILSRAGDGGTGMGLYISRLLVKAMKGEIGLVESSEKGSTFYFTLPKAT